jgi:hypothetical protein
MSPEFEALFLDSSGLKETLGVGGRTMPTWPALWTKPGRRPKDTIEIALAAAKHLRPQPTVFRQIRGGMRTAGPEWASYFLRKSGNRLATYARSHEISVRLREILGP